MLMASSHLVALAAQAVDTGSDGLTFMEILTDIPHDPAAVVVYVLSAFSVGWVLWAGTRKRPKGPGTPA